MLPLDSFDMLDATDVSSTLLLSKVGLADVKELAKSIFIVLLFGGGLIPASISANKSMIQTILGKRRGGDDIQTNPYIAASNASGPSLPFSALLGTEVIPLADVIAVIGRIPTLQAVADWKNLPSAKLPNVSPTNPPMWLPRSTFKQNIRNAPFTTWPIDAKGEPVGGQDLFNAENKRMSQRNIPDAALDAVFDTWAWGASVATPDKVQNQLSDWRSDSKSFDLNKFVGAAIRGRAVTWLGIITFIVIQVVAYGSLFIAPFLRVFFDIDIGFGSLGSCGVDGCTKLL